MITSESNRNLLTSISGVLRLGQQPLGRLAVEHVGIAQQLDQFIVGLLRQVERLRVRRVLVAHAVEPALAAIDALGIGVGVLVAVVPVVPVEDVQAAVRAGLLDDRHEPRVVGGEEIGELRGRRQSPVLRDHAVTGRSSSASALARKAGMSACPCTSSRSARARRR